MFTNVVKDIGVELGEDEPFSSNKLKATIIKPIIKNQIRIFLAVCKFTYLQNKVININLK
ncbi:hypothetical protein JCM8795_12480 [Hydrogenobaculum acidophilum]